MTYHNDESDRAASQLDTLMAALSRSPQRDLSQ